LVKEGDATIKKTSDPQKDAASRGWEVARGLRAPEQILARVCRGRLGARQPAEDSEESGKPNGEVRVVR
jgi:hypothetical protein